MAIERNKEGVFIDDTSIDEHPNVFPWVRFPSLERATYGLALHEGDAGSPEIDSIKVSESTFDPTTIAPMADFGEAVRAASEANPNYYFEEVPMVEIVDAAGFDHLKNAFVDPRYKAAWADAEFEKPGIYDGREGSFEGSVEDYEDGDMAFWAEDTLEYMFQGDEWKEALEVLLSRNKIEVREGANHMRARGMTGADLLKIVANGGYVDLAAKVRAADLLGQASDKFWKESAIETKKRYGKQIQAALDHLGPWAAKTTLPSPEQIKSEITKVLARHGVYAYPRLLDLVYHSGYAKLTKAPGLERKARTVFAGYYGLDIIGTNVTVERGDLKGQPGIVESLSHVDDAGLEWWKVRVGGTVELLSSLEFKTAYPYPAIKGKPGSTRWPARKA